ncbi:MAG: N-formylglutamate amidohydrolase [Bacteroidota bacterium]
MSFQFINPGTNKAPILLSIPHCGVEFPEELKGLYNSSLIHAPDDTDWFVDQLYDFSSELGISMISARYSRWVIDLNRDPESKPLYDDGRIITQLCPTHSFAGQELYRNGYVPTKEDITKRLSKYYEPYYQKIDEELRNLKNEFGYVIFWDAHSIRQYVPLIRQERFPDLILGDNDGKSANTNLSKIAFNQLRRRGHQINYNEPFKGGHLTRYFGRPETNQHALQLEMTKINYMNHSETDYDPQRAVRIRDSLALVFEQLLKSLDK